MAPVPSFSVRDTEALLLNINPKTAFTTWSFDFIA